MSNARATRRRNWIWYQLGKFQQTPGLEPDAPTDLTAEYVQMPKVRLSAGIEPTSIEWPNLGYAEVYQDSFAIFDKLQEEGTILAGVRFQVEYPTPLASINGWLVPEDQDKVEPSYERALLDDLDRLLAALPHDRIAVQWDVAVEFGILEMAFPGGKRMDDIVERLARDVDHVPTDVPVGLHLCYGDYQHQHFKEPESLAMQVEVLNRRRRPRLDPSTSWPSPCPSTRASRRTSNRWPRSTRRRTPSCTSRSSRITPTRSPRERPGTR